MQLLVITTYRTDAKDVNPSYEALATMLLEPCEGETQEAYDKRADDIVEEYFYKWKQDEQGYYIRKEVDYAYNYRLVDNNWEYIG